MIYYLLTNTPKHFSATYLLFIVVLPTLQVLIMAPAETTCRPWIKA